jgi:hypothetical protein
LFQETWHNEQEIEYQSTIEMSNGATQLAKQSNYSLVVGDERIDIGQVAVTWLAVHLEVID